MKNAPTSALKSHFLNPKGLKAQKLSTLEAPQRNYDFLNWRLDLHRIGQNKEVEENVATFRVDLRMTKPEIKQYLEKVYKLEVQRVNTVRIHGKIKKNMFGHRFKESEKKKAYVFLKDAKIEDFYKKGDQYV